ncbi:efflux RND transporter periplasmic adaptor subunit [Mesorhizobium sp. B2-3-3]|nr:efflux RND transporter periplasmic adaptor subunit [Mesorhizobium sp. B2-3-3]
MMKRMIFMLACFGLVFGGLYGFQQFKAAMIQKVMAGMANPAQTVSAMPVAAEGWQDTVEAVGSLSAVSGADLALQVSGIVKEIAPQSGDKVEAGQTLLQLNADDIIAKLAALQATAENYMITLKRDEEQLKIKAVSQATIDSDIANLKNAGALAAQQQAVVEQMTLKAPFAGRLGIRAVSVGQYLSAGTTAFTLQTLDPIFVDFYLPQQALGQLEVGQSITAVVDTYPDRKFAGEITAINPKVNSSTRNVQLRAVIRNADNSLLPGMFAKVTVSIGKPQQFITLPQTAIVRNSYGDSVFLIDGQGANQVARQVFVKTGLMRGDQVAVTSGVKQGETVVVAGQIKLRNGTPVKLDNSHAPPAEPSPNVIDQ